VLKINDVSKIKGHNSTEKVFVQKNILKNTKEIHKIFMPWTHKIRKFPKAGC